MIEINTNIVKQAVYRLCFEANTILNKEIYDRIYYAYSNTENEKTKKILRTILKNAKIAYEKKLPLCQDTGQVLVFLEIGQNILLKGELIENIINKAIEECYRDNYFRKSIVKNSIFDRNNTQTNTPAIIYTHIISGDELNIKILIKGAGSENKSKLAMLLPTASKEELIKTVGDLILSAKENACPPMFIGIGAGYTAEKAMILSKQALIADKFSQEEINLANAIKNYVNSKASETYSDCYVLDIKMLTSPTHIACLPIGITINCHSDRYASCSIKNGKIIYNNVIPEFYELEDEKNNKREISAQNINEIKSLKQGEEILLTGEIYIARDMAHKKLCEMIENSEKLPFDIKNKIILYAGPCPAKPREIIGSVGPTTSSRMDKYAPMLYKRGIIGTIGKGDRNDEVKQVILEFDAKYFILQGGVAAYLSQKIKKSEIVAFKDFGTEAVYKIFVEKLPLKVEL